METPLAYLPLPLYALCWQWVHGNPISLPALAAIGRVSEAGLLE